MMKRLICLLLSLALVGCSNANNEQPSQTPVATQDVTVETEVPQATKESESDTLPLVSIGIFNDINDPTLFAVVETHTFQNDEFTSIDKQPFYDFTNSHKDLIERYGYSGTYEDGDGEMLKEMGFTPQTLSGYNFEYYYNFYKVDESLIEEFLDILHNLKAKYGTQIQEGDSVPITYVEKSIEFKPSENVSFEFEPLPIAFNEDGYDYYLVNEAESLYIKAKDDISDVFTVGKRNKLYGLFYQGDVFIDCRWGFFVSDTAYTGHGESGGYSYAVQQLSDNLRLDEFVLIAMPHVSDANLQQTIENFDYDSIRMVIVD